VAGILLADSGEFLHENRSDNFRRKSDNFPTSKLAFYALEITFLESPMQSGQMEYCLIFP